MPLNSVSGSSSSGGTYQLCSAAPTGVEGSACRVGGLQPANYVISPTPSSSCCARFCQSLRSAFTIQPSDSILIKAGRVTARGLVVGIACACTNSAAAAASTALGQSLMLWPEKRWSWTNIQDSAIGGVVLGAIAGTVGSILGDIAFITLDWENGGTLPAPSHDIELGEHDPSSEEMQPADAKLFP